MTTSTSVKSLIITNENETVSLFGLIKIIYVTESLLYCLEYQLNKTLRLNRNLCAFEVAVTTLAMATELINTEKLVDRTSYYPVSFKSNCLCCGKKI